MPYQGMTGQGATAVLTAAGIVGCVRSITLPELSQDKVDASCLATIGFMKFIPGDLTDPGECQLELVFDGTYDFTLGGNAADPDGVVGNIDTLTVTFPVGHELNTSGAILAGTGFITNYSLPDLSTGNLAVVNVTFSFDGDIGPAFTPET
jgi:hypothetical protein